MVILSKALAVFLAVSGAAASPTRIRDAACTNKTVRRAWHTFTNDEKKAYIDAELCLMNTPSILEVAAAKTIFDDLHAIHHAQAYDIHNVGTFLSWHRMYVHTHEVVLRRECDYQGTIPYWNETIDAGNFIESPVLDPDTGFGGDGVAPNGCIADGPMVNYTSRFGPGYTVNDHCIYRSINNRVSTAASQANIDRCMVMDDFLKFWPCLEAAPHAAGHGGVGGLMMDTVSSPGDPVFFLHHAWLDKIWWQWQNKDLPARLEVIGGPNKPQILSFPSGGFPGGGFPGLGGNASVTPTSGAMPTSTAMPSWMMPGPQGGVPFDPDAMTPPDSLKNGVIAGDPGNVTTMGHVLDMLGVVPSATIADVMDTVGGILCYEYE